MLQWRDMAERREQEGEVIAVKRWAERSPEERVALLAKAYVDEGQPTILRMDPTLTYAIARRVARSRHQRKAQRTFEQNEERVRAILQGYEDTSTLHMRATVLTLGPTYGINFVDPNKTYGFVTDLHELYFLLGIPEDALYQAIARPGERNVPFVRENGFQVIASTVRRDITLYNREKVGNYAIYEPYYHVPYVPGYEPPSPARYSHDERGFIVVERPEP